MWLRNSNHRCALICTDEEARYAPSERIVSASEMNRKRTQGTLRNIFPPPATLDFADGEDSFQWLEKRSRVSCPCLQSLSCRRVAKTRFPAVDKTLVYTYACGMNRSVEFYETESGNRPAYKFIHSLDVPAKVKIVAALRQVEVNSVVPASRFCKMKGTDDLWEVRVRCQKNIFRILCFFDGSELIVAALGFQKKTQKTPLREIRTAEKCKKDYFKQKEMP